MKALKCDICGSFYDYDYDGHGITGFAFLNVDYSVINDICPDCLAAIKKVVDDRKKVRLKNARTENG